MSTAIGTYVSLETRTGANTNNNYQNFHAGETRTYESVDYMYERSVSVSAGLL